MFKEIVYQPHPLNPPLLEKERGNCYVREVKPLFDFLYLRITIGSFRGATAPLNKLSSPSPY